MSEIQHPADEHEMSAKRLEECRDELAYQEFIGHPTLPALLRDLLSYIDYLRGELALAAGREAAACTMIDERGKLLKNIVQSFDIDDLDAINEYLDEAHVLVGGMGNDPRAYVKAVKHE